MDLIRKIFNQSGAANVTRARRTIRATDKSFSYIELKDIQDKLKLILKLLAGQQLL